MKIAIIGMGNVGGTIAPGWDKAGKKHLLQCIKKTLKHFSIVCYET